MGMLTAGTAITVLAAMSTGGAAMAAPPIQLSRGTAHVSHTMRPPLLIKSFGHMANGNVRFANTASPTGLSPSAVASVYHLSGLAANSGAGAGQVIAIVDAFHDPNALSDLNTWNSQYGYPQLSTCTSLQQAGACFEQADPQGTPTVNKGWVLEESLDIEWAHAEAPAAKIVLVEAASASNADLFGAAQYAGSTLGATEVSMSFGGTDSASDTQFDADLAHPGTLYAASAGDSGHGAEYPAASPNVIAVGGTTLTGCSGTSCAGFSGESAWSGSGGGASTSESLPGYQSSYTGPVSGASSISALTGGKRGIPDVSFEADPNTGVSVYDSTRYQLQSGWWTLGGTSVSAPNWAGILAAGAAAGQSTLQGDSHIYAGGSANLRDITSGTNGTCGTACTAGAGYDLVTGLGSPVNYP
jgi:subtilase family serine protease